MDTVEMLAGIRYSKVLASAGFPGYSNEFAFLVLTLVAKRFDCDKHFIPMAIDIAYGL